MWLPKAYAKHLCNETLNQKQDTRRQKMLCMFCDCSQIGLKFCGIQFKSKVSTILTENHLALVIGEVELVSCMPLPFFIKYKSNAVKFCRLQFSFNWLRKYCLWVHACNIGPPLECSRAIVRLQTNYVVTVRTVNVLYLFKYLWMYLTKSLKYRQLHWYLCLQYFLVFS